MSASHRSNTIGAYEAKTRLSELLDKVEGGAEITITKHGSPVARLVPIKKTRTAEERAAAIGRIQKMGGKLSLGSLKVRDLIKQGRK
jgi:prevent-host-death family protein